MSSTTPPPHAPTPDMGQPVSTSPQIPPLTAIQPPSAENCANPVARQVNQHPTASGGVPRQQARPVTVVDVRRPRAS